LSDFLQRRITQDRPSLTRDVVWSVGCAGAAVGLRWLVDPIFVNGAPFLLFVPSVLAASIYAGSRAGLMCLALCAAASLGFVVARDTAPTLRIVLGESLFILVGLVTIRLVASLRGAVAQLQARDRQQRLLVAELQHRVKNTLAIVQAIARQTTHATADPARIRHDLTDRLVALSQAYNLVVEAPGESIDLAALAGSALQPFTLDQAPRITLAGPAAQVPADLAISVALCLHELATNALKHGALSGAAGQVALAWAFVPPAGGSEPRLRLAWREQGGPAVPPPTRSGFGSRLLQRGLGGRSRPRVSLDFAPDGVAWTAEFDLTPPVQDIYATGLQDALQG
jgi:two-component sensor histidine kinase